MSDNINIQSQSTDPPAEPLTREEQYLSAIAGVTPSSDIPEKPLTRIERYLNKIVENGGGGSGFEPTDEQLAAMNSGITSEDVEQISTNKTNISSCKAFTDNASIDSDRKLYISATEPTGDIPQGSTWIDGKTIKSMDRTDNLFNKFDVIGQVPSISTGELVDYNGATCTPISISDGNITLSKPSTDDIVIYLLLYDNNMTYIGYGQVSGSSTTIIGNTITGYANAKYCRVRINRQTGLDIAIMINTGSTAEPYVSYLTWQ